MEIAYIRFESVDDEAMGVRELARVTRVNGYRGDVWSVGRQYLRRLDELKLAYRPATEAEVEAALAADAASVVPSRSRPDARPQ
jgi:hypothetical protein